MTDYLFSYCQRIIGKDPTKTERIDFKTKQPILNRSGEPVMDFLWTKFRNRFSNYPKRTLKETDGIIGLTEEPIDRDTIVKMVAHHGYATAFILKDDTLRVGRSQAPNILGARMMMVDFDNTCSLEEIKQHPWWNKVWFSYTTPSFGKIQEPLEDTKRATLPDDHYEIISQQVGLPKRNFRLVFRFERFVPYDEMIEVMNGFRSIFPLSDQAITDGARLMFGSKKAQVEYPETEYVLKNSDIELLKEASAADRPVRAQRERQRTQKLMASQNFTGEFDIDSPIDFQNGETWSIREVLELMPLGWHQPCYSPFRPEDNPSAYVHKFEDGGNVLVYDTGAGLKKVFRPIVKEQKRLQLVRKEPETEKEDLEITTVEVKKPKAHPQFQTDYVLPMTLLDRQKHIKSIVNQLERSNLFFAPEGFGKSFVAVALLSRRRKILFCTQSNEQAEKKAEEFAKLKRGGGFVFLSMPKVQCVVSKDYIFKQNTGLSIAREQPLDPFGLPEVNKLRSLEFLMEQTGCSEEEAETIWATEYEPITTEKPNFQEFDIICTTMARAEIIARHHIEHMLPNPLETDPDEWVVIYDDPSFGQVCNLIYKTEAWERRIDDHNHKIRDFNVGKQPLDRKPEIILKQQKFIAANRMDDRVYYVRPEGKKLGQNFRTFGENSQHIPVIYTTTEELTGFFVESLDHNVKVFDFMHDTYTENLTIWGTSMVHQKNDGLIILTVDLLKLDFPQRNVSLIGDGLGQPLNHTNSKGQNALSERDIVIELSQLHPNEALHNQDEVEFLLGKNHSWSQQEIQGVMLRDKMHQAIGRNSGYRERDGSYQTIVLCDPHYWEGLTETSRYKPAPWSAQLDLGTGKSLRSEVTNRKKSRELLNYSGEMPEIIETLQHYITEKSRIFEHPEFSTVVKSAIRENRQIRNRIKLALETQLEKNRNQSQMLESLIDLC